MSTVQKFTLAALLIAFAATASFSKETVVRKERVQISQEEYERYLREKENNPSQERSSGKIKELYPKEKVEKALKGFREAKNKKFTEKEIYDFVNRTAQQECIKETNEEISKNSYMLGGRRIANTSKTPQAMTRDCFEKKAPKLWDKQDSLLLDLEKTMDEGIKEAEFLLTIEGCKKQAESDKDCTDDLIVKFNRFGYCTCETY